VPDFRDKKILADGAYLFKPDLNTLFSLNYGALDADVTFEHG